MKAKTKTFKATKNKAALKPETLKLKGDWQALIGQVLTKKRPKKG